MKEIIIELPHYHCNSNVVGFFKLTFFISFIQLFTNTLVCIITCLNQWYSHGVEIVIKIYVMFSFKLFGCKADKNKHRRQCAFKVIKINEV